MRKRFGGVGVIKLERIAEDPAKRVLTKVALVGGKLSSIMI